jgi:1-acyl-sn-glycerol-3-phosphate acyltransferase
MRRKMPEAEQAEAGLGLLAASTEVPVLPVSIITKRLMPGIFRRTRIVIGKPIPASEYLNFCENPRKKQIAEYCFNPVCEQFNKNKW